jgi:hypothetical protein
MNLCDYLTGEIIREATRTEARLSAHAARYNGGTGVIEVDGRLCWVDGPCPDCDAWDCVCPEKSDRYFGTD